MQNSAVREISQEKEDKINKLRSGMPTFLDLVRSDTSRPGLISYVALKSGVNKPYVASYVAQVYSNIDIMPFDDEDDDQDSDDLDLEVEEDA